MSVAERSESPVPLGRLMSCDRCGHDEHVLSCGADVDAGVECCCRDVPVPGIYPFVPRGPRHP